MTTGGATFTQIGASNQWQIHSGLDAHNEIITFLSGATIHSTDYLLDGGGAWREPRSDRIALGRLSASSAHRAS